jgi:DNA repair protein RecO (recombination protein O)
MRVLGEPAFVLHARPWRETSAIVELLTRGHGRVGIVARGLTTPKKQALRAALQPLQRLRVDYQQRGELARLVMAEAVDIAPALAGERLMAALYVNELMLRLTPRNDPAPALFDLYARVRGELVGAPSLAWALRRFERDLLDALGVGLPWDSTADGEPCAPEMRYRLDAEVGPVPAPSRLVDSVGGEALLALAADRQPAANALAELRRALRMVLQSHLGATPLHSWGLLDELSRVRPRQRPD